MLIGMRVSFTTRVKFWLKRKARTTPNTLLYDTIEPAAFQRAGFLVYTLLLGEMGK